MTKTITSTKKKS